MKKRLIIYFHYHPRGQADTACRFAVQKMSEVGEVLFVHNGALGEDSRVWAEKTCKMLLERENTGLDVGACRDAVLRVGAQGLDAYEEVVLMNYTLAGPVGDIGALFARMDARAELDFWGLTRHYAMHSRRFGGKRGQVPEHLQSHFLAVRPSMYADFLRYWQEIPLPQSYEASVAGHETRFTPYFAARGYRWDSAVDTAPLSAVFVNPIMACPAVLVQEYGCPFFKRRSFFTPYADELRRTDGQAAAELYRCLKTRTSYPVDALLRDLLPVQPLAAMAQNLHWHTLLTGEEAGEPPVFLNAEALAGGFRPDAGKIYCLPLPPWEGDAAADYYLCRTAPCAAEQRQAAALLKALPLMGVLGPALPPYPACAAQKLARWRRQRPAVQQRLKELGVSVPLDETPPPLPNGGALLVRGAAFPQGLPPLQAAQDFWLVPLLAQAAGYGSADYETPEQCRARADVLQAVLAGQQGVGASAKLLGRAVKTAVRSRRKKGAAQ